MEWKEEGGDDGEGFEMISRSNRDRSEFPQDSVSGFSISDFVAPSVLAQREEKKVND